MRGLRHALEAIARPDWRFLADAYSSAAALPQPGARRWAIAGLGVLREPDTVPAVIAALRDGVAEVRAAACTSLRMICETNPDVRASAIVVLEELAADPRSGSQARKAIDAVRTGR